MSTSTMKNPKNNQKESESLENEMPTKRRSWFGVGCAILLGWFTGNRCPFCSSRCGDPWCPYN